MHILRHTFAAGCIEAGMNPKTLKISMLKSLGIKGFIGGNI